MPKHQLIIATRESPLALKQAMWVKERLEILHQDLEVHLLGLTTEADQMLNLSLMTVGGKGLFVKELEQALLDKRADIAVHSMKDVPMSFPKGLCLPVICEREDPRDVLVSSNYKSIQNLPQKATIGTSSLRRQSQLLALRPDLKTVSLRGNVNTRLKQLEEGRFDAIILAAAGLKRLKLLKNWTYISPEQMLPAAGQGALGIECREADTKTRQLIDALTEEQSFICVSAERAVCKSLGAGCQVPVGAFAEILNDQIKLRAIVGSLDGKQILRAEKIGSISEAESLGTAVAEDLLSQGAGELLKLS